MSNKFASSSLLLLFSSLSLAAQRPRVSPPRDPAWYQGIESQTLYFVRGTDTTKVTGTAPRIARLQWIPGARGSALFVTTTTLDVHRAVLTDTLRLDSLNNVVAITSGSPSPRDRYALFLRLPVPPGALDSGATWGDTLAPGWPAPGTRSLSVHVTDYSIEGAVDTLGGKATVIQINGIARYRESSWSDSAAGRSYQVDAVGPMHETWWLDPAHGELLARRRRLELEGVGVVPAENGADTIPVGVSADDAWGRISEARARVLARPLPGTDTSVTIATAPILLHTVRRLGDAIESALAGNDGTVGTALLETSSARPRQYQSLWTGPGAPDQAALASVHDDSLYLTGTRAGKWRTPSRLWAISDEGMEEQLVPALETLRDSQTVILSLFRPRAAQWDSVKVIAKFLPNGARLFLLSAGGLGARSAILVDSTGDLLTVEHATTPPTRRLPPFGTERRARLDQIFALFGLTN